MDSSDRLCASVSEVVAYTKVYLNPSGLLVWFGTSSNNLVGVCVSLPGRKFLNLPEIYRSGECGVLQKVRCLPAVIKFHEVVRASMGNQWVGKYEGFGLSYWYTYYLVPCQTDKFIHML